MGQIRMVTDTATFEDKFMDRLLFVQLMRAYS